MTRKVYYWCCELGDNPNDISNWFIDSVKCENCFSSLKLTDKYCPQCGELIEGIKNNKPPIKENE